MKGNILADPDAYYDRIRVSVIIPAYNVEAYVRQCLDSILVRDELRTEIICVDDGSTDHTLEILREYEQKYSHVRVISQENAGAGAARNNGMQYAHGEYLAFLDADDFFDPEMLRVAYEKAHLEDSDIVVFKSDNYNESSRSFTPLAHSIKLELLPAQRPFAGRDIARNAFRAFVGWPWDKLFRADFVRKYGLKFQEQRTTNDMLFVFSAIVKAERISVISNRTLAHHRRDDVGGSLSVTREKSWDCFYRALTALKKQLLEWGEYPRFEQDFINYALHFSLWNLNTIKGDAYALLYSKLKEEWFGELGITDKGELYFYIPSEYAQYQAVMTLTPEEYIYYRMDGDSGKIAALEAGNRKLREQLKEAESKLKKAGVSTGAVRGTARLSFKQRLYVRLSRYRLFPKALAVYHRLRRRGK